jgi:hypothetical protein
VVSPLKNNLNENSRSLDIDSSFEDYIPSLRSSPDKVSPQKQIKSPVQNTTHYEDHNDNINSFDVDSSFDDIPSLPSSPSKLSHQKLDSLQEDTNSLKSDDNDDNGDDDDDQDRDNIVSFTSLGESFVDSDTRDLAVTETVGDDIDNLGSSESTVDEYIKSMGVGSSSDIILADDDMRSSLYPDQASQHSSHHTDSSTSSTSFDLAAEKQQRVGNCTENESGDISAIGDQIPVLDTVRETNDIDADSGDDHDWDDDSSSSDDDDDEKKEDVKVDADLEKARALVKSTSSNIFGFSALEDSVDISRSGSEDDVKTEETTEKSPSESIVTSDKNLKGRDDSDSDSDSVMSSDDSDADDTIKTGKVIYMYMFCEYVVLTSLFRLLQR